MSSESTTAAADTKFSAPVEDDWATVLDAATDDNAMSFPEEEDWDEDEFGGGDSDSAEGGERSGINAGESCEINDGDPPPMVTNTEEGATPTPQSSSFSEGMNSESPINAEETDGLAVQKLSTNEGESADNSMTCVADNTTTTNAAELLATNDPITTERRRQRRERRQVKSEGRQQQQPPPPPLPTPTPREQSKQQLAEPPEQQPSSAEIAVTAVGTESTSSPTSQLTRRQRMTERVAQGKVTLRVKPKSISQAGIVDNNDDVVIVAPISPSTTPQTHDPHLLITPSNNGVELLIGDDETQKAKLDLDNDGKLLLPSYIDPSSLLLDRNSSSSSSPLAPIVDKNEARRQRRSIRNNKSHEKEEKSTLELLIMAETALAGSNDNDENVGVDDHDHPPSLLAMVQDDEKKKEISSTITSVDKTTLPPTSTTAVIDTHLNSPPRTSCRGSVSDDDDNDDYDEDIDPIMADRISRALDDARVKREAKSQNGSVDNINTKELFDVEYNSMEVLNEDETRLFFPTQDAMEVSIVKEGETSVSIAPEAAWDAESSAKLRKALEESRARNSRMAKTDDEKPLLQLETAVSDNDDKETLEAASSSKLMSQHERIAMYTSGGGFGVGEDSSVENDSVEGDTESAAVETDEDDNDDAVGYKDLTTMYDANDADDETSHEVLDLSDVGKISHDNVLTFSIEAFEASKERAQRWSRNPDAVSDIDDDSDCYLALASGVKGNTGDKIESSATMIKIPPPPPEKLQHWMESKSGGSTPAVTVSNSKEVELSPPTSKSRENEVKLNTSPYKINTPKSPVKKKPNTIIEELDLKSHKKMAEKIAFASSKAAKKFEEEYVHGNLQEGQSAEYFRPIDLPQTKSPISPERTVLMPTVGELVGGAFSPWKIPERDDDSNMSLNRAFSDTESFANVTAAALRAMNSSEQEKKRSLQKEGKLPEESFEVSLQIDDAINEDEEGVLTEVLQWLFDEVLPPTSSIAAAFSAFDLNISTTVQADRVRAISNDNESFNIICEYVSAAVMSKHSHKIDKCEQSNEGGVTGIKPFIIPISLDSRPKAEVLATSFITFLQQVSILAEKPLPWGGDNALLDSVMNNLSAKHLSSKKQRKTMQDLVFPDEESVITIFQYLRDVCGHYQTSTRRKREKGHNRSLSPEFTHSVTIEVPQNVETSISTVRRSNQRKRISKAPAKLKNPLNKESLRKLNNLNLIFPKTSPSPFETAVWNDPSIILSILSFVGNPVTVCVFKRLNVFCNRVVCENEHVLMRDAVRLGGMSKYARPSFWLWVTEKSQPEDPIPLIPQRQGLRVSSKQKEEYHGRDFITLKDLGAAGKWHPIIERDVTRAFGNMPPHKTGARYRQDSIVRALVTFGKEELIRSSRSYQAKTMDRLPEGSQAKHFKLSSRLDHREDENCDSSDGSMTPTDTVSDWGGISPVASYASEDHIAGNIDDPKVQIVSYESIDANSKSKLSTAKSDISDPVLCGNALTSEMKVDMQNKLRSILHALAARHQGVGYCQGMDYIVAHLLRVLQDTILLRVIKAEDWHTMPNEMLRKRMSEINSNTEIVEEVVFHVMDTFFTTYSLQHMYWPELRCLKTCCRVFEILIRQKLPVLADHFEHHDLNVGLFALGWFQTLFLYLPSMPSATVCHMWDIWLVERSFKIFFRVGTAILFLSQPTLLNHDLEGMMTYLNTFPDATLLRADILIPCALQIKITNKMLVEVEMEATDFINRSQPPLMG